MPGKNTGEKKKLIISPCTIESNGKVTVDQREKYEVMLNPSGFTHQYAIEYNQKKALGQVGSDSKFSAVNAEKVSFDIVIDGTGVVNQSNGADVKTRVRQLNGIVYKYDGNNHEPNHVRILWGSLIFFGRLQSMSIEYTLFKPSGEPLRAKAKLAFAGFMSKEEAVLKADRSSPDLTHHIEVKAGDTLPLLCYRIYKDSSYYPEVAKANNMVNFRDIKPGTLIHFPPLR